MEPSKEAGKLREIIEKAMEDGVITRDEFDKIIFTATSDGHIDDEEKALLTEMQTMINTGVIKFK